MHFITIIYAIDNIIIIVFVFDLWSMLIIVHNNIVYNAELVLMEVLRQMLDLNSYPLILQLSTIH